MRASLIGFFALAAAAIGCKAPPATPLTDAAAAADLAVEVAVDAAQEPPDLAKEVPVERTFCRDVECRPPVCCGAVCQTNAQCCPGTICGKELRCAPAACAGCGEIGCTVDYLKCTATCSKPACCLKACNVDGDCCPGARCQLDTKATKLCMPKACDSCDGFKPICSLNAMCDLKCLPPATCGTKCNIDNECGVNNKCYAFPGGDKLCVPAIFQPACNACGPKGCLFYPDKCGVECKPAVGDGGAGPSDGGVVEDAGAQVVDAAVVDAAVVDASAKVDLAVCKACCAPCGFDFECCPGMRCEGDGKGNRICQPASCAQCTFGCSFFCPPN